jgi:hypothetical protein
MKNFAKWISSAVLRVFGLALIVAGVLLAWKHLLFAQWLATPDNWSSRPDAMRYLSPSFEPGIGARFAVLLCAFAAMGAGVALRRVGRRITQRSADEALASTTRPPVLYLRAFSRDTEATLLPRDALTEAMRSPLDRERSTFEEELATRLRHIGPVVALGKPGDVLPPIGASRSYVPDDEWKDRVASWVEEAALVVMLVDATDAVRWELSQVARSLEKLWLILPPARTGASARDPAWEASWERLRSEFAYLPAVGAEAAMVRFTRGADGCTAKVLSGLSSSAWDVLDVVQHAVDHPGEEAESPRLAIMQKQRDELCAGAASVAKMIAGFFALCAVAFFALFLFAETNESPYLAPASALLSAISAVVFFALSRGLGRASIIAIEAALAITLVVAAFGIALAIRFTPFALLLTIACLVPFLRLLQARRAAISCMEIEKRER